MCHSNLASILTAATTRSGDAPTAIRSASKIAAFPSVASSFSPACSGRSSGYLYCRRSELTPTLTTNSWLFCVSCSHSAMAWRSQRWLRQFGNRCYPVNSWYFIPNVSATALLVTAPPCMFTASLSPGVFPQAFANPSLAIPSTYGNVTLHRA